MRPKGDLANQTFPTPIETGVASQLANRSFYQVTAKARAIRHLHNRTIYFRPGQGYLSVGRVGPLYFDLTIGGSQRSIFGRIGCQLMKNHSKRLSNCGLQ